ncbi:MAG: Re/Si-specific NAD(P)(+) transhydrogenase subunit alpha [Holosporaceae bacterium]|jgi:NAD(P) transhydrogenase subunit alpha|nr:Re/Si-specific NAD(P)(+) transhydrogenase subunit alpha [Holosporaceae bacterium]
MRIAALTNPEEKRVAVTPETTKKYIDSGFEVILPENFGISAGFNDEEYVKAGAIIEKKEAVPDADLYLCVRPSFKEKLKPGSCLAGLMSPFENNEILQTACESGVRLFALEKIPRISRAQSADVLSSQANIAGYRAMLEGFYEYRCVVPLMMTAAGTVRPAKVLVLGAGVAGLQAIATAKRFGASVSAFDVRAAAEEQVKSLGASFVKVENDDSGETSEGYAKEMSALYKKRQAEKLAQVIAETDVAVTTAQIPGKPAPKLITEEMVDSMAAGSVIVDMSAETGGNCELSEKDKLITSPKGVKIIGYTDFAARAAPDASRLFARNVFNFVSLMVKDGKIDTSDEIVKAAIIEVKNG